MAGPTTSRRRTVRQDASLAADRPVQLDAQRRFLSATGNSHAVRAANALTNAFTGATDLSAMTQEAALVEGRADATTSRGAGEARQESKNAGYNAAWDQLDAESHLNKIKKDLPKHLQEMDAESMGEEELQATISEYMQGQFDGFEPNSPYGKVLAPGLAALEEEYLGAHRDEVFAMTQQGQRADINTNLQERVIEADGAWDQPSPIDGLNPYEYLAQQTDQFFDGENKRTAYLESVFDAAIRAGDVRIIDNMPPTFPDGSQTGINDPNMADEFRKQRAAALAAGVRREAAEALERKSDLNSAALEMVVAVNSGATPTPDMIESYAALPGADATVTAALSKTLTTLSTNVDKAKGDDRVISYLTKEIYKGSPYGSQSAISQAYLNGELGEGDSGVNQYQELMALAEQNDRIAATGNKDKADIYLDDVNSRYAIIRGPLGNIMNLPMAEINRQATMELRIAIADGKDPATSWEEITEKFDARRERQTPSINSPPREKFTTGMDFLNNQATADELQASGLTMDDILSLNITDAEKNQLLDGLEARF